MKNSARDIGYNPFAAHYGNQCTYYAEERMHSQTGRYMPVYGNAYQWATQAAAGGWTVGTTPATNSVAVFPAGAFGSSVGHVAWVIAVGSGTVAEPSAVCEIETASRSKFLLVAEFPSSASEKRM